MKKNFYLGFIALTALTVTSCSNDDVVMQSPDVNKAIEFGTYLGRDAQSRGLVITQSGSTADGNGTITTDALTQKGFGVFAYYTDESGYVATTSPCNFMYNTKVSTVDWTYSPIKYWPNDPNDKLTFFAYAPYDDADTNVSDEEEYDNISFNTLGNMKGDPVITFKVNNDVKKQQDLLLSRSENIDIIKNNGANSEVNVGNKVNFQFAHVLSRIGFTVKAITDEVTAQTPKPLDAATTIVLKKVVLYGGNRVTGNTVPTEANVNGIFYTQGELNLNQQNINAGENGAYTNVAWTNIVGDDNNDAKQLFTLDNDDFVAQSAGATIYDEQGFILTENQGIIGTGNANSTKVNKLNTDDSFLMIIPQNLAANGFYVYAEYDVITLDPNLGNTSGLAYENLKSKITNHISTPIAINFQSGKAYTLNLQLGMTSVKVTADVDDWKDGGNTSVDLPQNTQGQ